jgi:hypothetical protein
MIRHLILLFGVLSLATAALAVTYPVVDTGQTACYGNGGEIAAPAAGQPFYGQDAQVAGLQPSYKDNGDGTVTDLHTGLMWVKARGQALTWDAAKAGAATCRVAQYTDWRMPTIKELYSLINFNGYSRQTAATSKPYLDTKYFDFVYGDGGSSVGSRLIDCQDWSSTLYVSTTMNGNKTAFGVNFADGRIKGYRLMRPDGATITHYVRYVRGNPKYGQNSFAAGPAGTVVDNATGLMWSKADSGTGMHWQDALAWVQAKNAAKYLGFNDWRLPNAKELQSLVDYSRSPDTSGSAAIDPIFQTTAIKNEGGKADFPFYWASTTHLDGMAGVYVCFGRGLGFMQMPPNSGNTVLLDVHGAGAQRSDPKAGNAADYPTGRGPQGDVIRILNYVRLVRGGASAAAAPTANAAVVHRPDLLIRTAAAKDFAGAGVYNTNGDNQTVTQRAALRTRVTFIVRLQNNGTATDTFLLSGPGDPAWMIRYFNAPTSTQEITQLVARPNGGVEVTVDAGKFVEMRLEVTPMAINLPAGIIRTVPITAVLTTDKQVADVVVAAVVKE